MKRRANQVQTLVLVGWKSIGQALGVGPDTARKWHHRRKMPVTRETPLGPPCIAAVDLIEWQRNGPKGGATA